MATLKTHQYLFVRLLTVVALTCASMIAYAQSELRVQQYPLGDKISQSKISHFVQDDNGFIWFGTFDGLMRFDGEHTQLFKTYPGDSVRAENHRIMNIRKLDDGNLWCSVYGRSCYYFDTHSYQFHSTPDQSFAEYQRYEEEQVQRMSAVRDSLYRLYPIQSAVLRYVYTDAKQRLWLLGNEDQVYLVENGMFRQVSYVGHRVPSTTAAYQVAFEDDYGTVWVQPGDSLPLAYYNEKLGRLEQAYTYEGGRRHPLNFYMRIGALDNQHNFWGNIDEEGFCYLSFHRQEFDFVGGTDPQSEMGARAMLMDHQGHLWVGWRRDSKDERGGLALYDSQRQLLGYLTPDGQLTTNIAQSIQHNAYSICEDSHHRIWVGTRNHGLYVFEPLNNEATSFRAHHFENLGSASSGRHGVSIYDIIEDHQGRMWFACYGDGLFVMEDFLSFQAIGQVGEEFRHCRCLCESSDHRMWLGTTRGLLVWENKDKDSAFQLHQVRCNDDAESLSCSNVMHVMEQHNGRMLISTFGGGINAVKVSSLDSLRFEHFDARRGRYPDVVFSIHEDHKGQLWVVSENGLTKYDSQLQLQCTFLSGTPCSEARLAENVESGQMYVASKYDVLCILHPEREASHFEPQIAFTDMNIYRQDTTCHFSLTPVDSLISVAAGDRNFTLSFLALDYSAPKNIQYQYRIVERHNQWLSLGNNPVVSIVDLPAGSYTLQVRSTNADGIWCNNQKQIHLSIAPYFYEALWFRILLWLLLLTAAGYGLYLWIRHIDQKRKAGYENRLASAKVRFITEVATQHDPEKERFVQKLIAYIESQLENETFSIEAAASEMNMSYAAFYRKVRTLMDVSPVDLVKQLRMQRAQHLLSTEDSLPISEVAYRCGFSTPQYFNRVFKETMGLTPVEYRTKMHEKSAKSC